MRVVYRHALRHDHAQDDAFRYDVTPIIARADVPEQLAVALRARLLAIERRLTVQRAVDAAFAMRDIHVHPEGQLAR